MEERRYPLRNRKQKEFPEFITYLAMHKDEESEPATYEEALSSSDKSKWKEAIKQKLEAFQTNEAWTIVDRPSNKPVVKSKWVFKIKRNPRNLSQIIVARDVVFLEEEIIIKKESEKGFQLKEILPELSRFYLDPQDEKMTRKNKTLNKHK